jgi:bifunctional DNase/RNase
VHLTLGIQRQSQAVFYALSFFWLDGFAVPAPAQVMQTVGRWQTIQTRTNLVQTMQMINAVIDSVRKPEEEAFRFVVLKETDKERYLAIPVRSDYGEFLVLSLEKTEQNKDAPLHLYDFLKELVDYGRLKIDRVIISDRKDTYYLAKIVVTAPSIFSSKQKVLDCYAADALIIAVRTNAPIYVTETLMAEEGLSPADGSNRT